MSADSRMEGDLASTGRRRPTVIACARCNRDGVLSTDAAPGWMILMVADRTRGDPFRVDLCPVCAAKFLELMRKHD